MGQTRFTAEQFIAQLREAETLDGQQVHYCRLSCRRPELDSKFNQQQVDSPKK